MKKLSISLIILVCVLIAGSYMPAQAMAQTPSVTLAAVSTTQTEQASGFEVSGTFAWDKVAQDSLPVIENGKWVGKATTYQDYHGDLEGKFVIQYTVEISLEDGKCTSTVEGSFTGTVNGKQGSFTTREVGYDRLFLPDLGIMTCWFAVMSGTGELSGLCGDIITCSSFDQTSLTGEYWGTLSYVK